MRGKEIEIGGKKLVVTNEILKSTGGKIYFIVDFETKFEEPDISKIPVRAVEIKTNEEEYLLRRYNIVVGEIERQC
ncbi:hypothetical protein [Caldicellulosiruptor naganoensis]|uniref:Uncharacterized protein n=1 Tax=Caldicellulosiruptor naganoensis TaxID=29324 RepID=A0ABY7BLF5_9FIRM|nr:hypothetical protein [Caldicellulosiruptor naganoensis]WAM31861.1 hypothetical protein OTJ99_000338 [Caldicellulosiruptor naganoensis]